MAVYEKNVLLTSQDRNGNKSLLYPITRLDCVEGGEELAVFVTPQMFGAVGDGVADDTPAIKAAIQECANTSKTLYVPAGTYKLTDILNFNNIKIVGSDPEKCILKMADQATTREWFICCGNKVSIHNIQFVQAIDGSLLGMLGCQDSVVENCTFRVEEGTIPNGYFDLYRSNSNIRITNCRFLNYAKSNMGGVWVRNSENTISENIIFDKCTFEHKTKDEVVGVWGWQGTVQDVAFRDCSFETIDEEYSSTHMITLGQAGVTRNVTMEHCCIKNRFAHERTIYSTEFNDAAVTEKILINNSYIYIGGTAANAMPAFGDNIVFTNCDIVTEKAQSLSDKNTFDHCRIEFRANGNFARSATIANGCTFTCRGGIRLAAEDAVFKNCVIDFCGVKNTGFLFEGLGGTTIKMDGCEWRNCAGFDSHMGFNHVSNFGIEFINCKGIQGHIYSAVPMTFNIIGNELSSSFEIWVSNYTGHIRNNIINGIFIPEGFSDKTASVPKPNGTSDEGKFLRSVGGVPTWVALTDVSEVGM